jgi:hypothetical protein
MTPAATTPMPPMLQVQADKHGLDAALTPLRVLELEFRA